MRYVLQSLLVLFSTNAFSFSDAEVTKYYDCQRVAGEIRSNCGIGNKTCIETKMIELKNFKSPTDYEIVAGSKATEGQFFIQCRINGHAPSRRELGAPKRSGEPPKKAPEEVLR